MARPRKCRRVEVKPDVTYFKPRGVPMTGLQDVLVPIEGLEAIRLADHQGMSHASAAAGMDVSRQTFGRILAKARKRIAEALVFGLALRIQGGTYAVADNPAGVSAEESAGAAPKSEVSPHQTQKEAVMAAEIAISSEGPDLDAMLDPRFGRAAGFILIDPQTLAYEYVDNGSSQAMVRGAGIQAAENVVNRGARVVLTGYVGPKAFKALNAAGIKVGQNMASMTVRQAVAAYNDDKVAWARQPSRKGHGR